MEYPRAVFLYHAINKTEVYNYHWLAKMGQKHMHWQSVTKIHQVGTQSTLPFRCSKLSQEPFRFVISLLEIPSSGFPAETWRRRLRIYQRFKMGMQVQISLVAMSVFTG
ncbi:hypothetical protein DITRI_Ditri14bG0021400 [Diplodiscus trichospermus]